MKYIDLIEALPAEDKVKIVNYITINATSDHFIGLDRWLQDWSHSKQNLYHLLGNSFIRQFPVTVEMPKTRVLERIHVALCNNNSSWHFKDTYHRFYYDYIRDAEWLTQDDRRFFNHLLDTENFYNGTCPLPLKIKRPDAQKMLQIQPGTKILKAVGRVIDYFKDIWEFDLDHFENFKKLYAIIVSEKTLTGKLCVSIHPLDFMTMSDNDSNWTSCMSWKEQGCYHVGTVEMMNSNNVLCCYFLSGKDNLSLIHI